ncbi:MAG: hypothetical protein ACKPFK_31680, partial [Dolichospermum sp.]
MKTLKLLPLLVIFLTACSSSTKQSELHKQAASIHNEMILSAEQLEEWLELQNSDTTSTLPADSLSVWMSKLEAWEADLV